MVQKLNKWVAWTLFIPLLQGLAQPATSVNQASHPMGILAQFKSPYEFGDFPTVLPKDVYQPASAKFGSSKHAYTAYINWKIAYSETCSDGSIRIKYDDPVRTVSEGIGYGMLLAAYAGDKTFFDGLWKYYKSNSVTGRNIMGWNRTGCSNGDAGNGGNGGATDAELDAALALLVAKCQWPAATSPYVYDTEATTLINAIKAWEIHPTSKQTINGDGWGFGNTCRNPSYFSPAYYKLFALQVPADSSFWAVDVVNAGYTMINANRNASNGLVSNWCNTSGTPTSCGGPIDYGYDACRNPWRMATDVLWFNDANAKDLLQKQSAWLNGYAGSAYGPISLGASAPNMGQNLSVVFTSTWAAGTMGGGNQNLLNQFYTQTQSMGDEGYFGTTLKVISLFMMTGNFWKPCSDYSFANVTQYTGTQDLGKVTLTWTTGMEIMADSFYVYYSPDGINYVKVGAVEAGTKNYSFEEMRYINLRGYYKIVLLDENGEEQALQVIPVDRYKVLELSYYPNPFDDQIKLYLSIEENEPYDLEIRDIYSRKITSITVQSNATSEAQLMLEPGMYFISTKYQGKWYSFKLVKN